MPYERLKEKLWMLLFLSQGEPGVIERKIVRIKVEGNRLYF